MRIFYFLSICLVPTLFTGCSIHPQTEDFSRNIVPTIIYKIRCEARAAIMETVPDKRDYLRGTVIAYRFFFKMTEDDDATSKGTVAVPIGLGTFTMGWSSGAEKQRDTEQAIEFEDAFSELVNLSCGENDLARNYIYPATGNIGLQDTFRNFVRLDKAKPGSLTTFTDQIQFTTQFSLSGMPKVRLTPAANIINAEATLSAGRIDVHQIKFTFTPPKTPQQLFVLDVKKKKAQAKKLADLKEQRQKYPMYVTLVDVGPGGKVTKRMTDGSGTFFVTDTKKNGQPAEPLTYTPLRVPAARETLAERKQRARRDADNERGLLLQERILDNLGE